jgi:hypothetical protein
MLFVALFATILFVRGMAWAGSIEGKIIRKADGAGLAGIDVRVYTGNWQPFKSTVSGESGSYVVREIPEGRYFVQAAGEPAYAVQFHPGTSVRREATPVEILEGEPPLTIDFVLRGWGSLSGRVLASDRSSPLPRVHVRVYDSRWRPLLSVQTDDAGVFKVGRLGTGRYHLLTWNDQGLVDVAYPGVPLQGGPWPPDGAEPVGVELDAETGNIVLALVQGGEISGRVTKERDGSPLEEVNISVRPLQSNDARETKTNGLGEYTVAGLIAGKYLVKASNREGFADAHYAGASSERSASPVQVEQGHRSANVNFRLVEGGSISGRISDEAGVGIPGVEVRLYDTEWEFRGSGKTDDHGVYRVGGLAAGAYLLKTSSGAATIDRCYGSEKGCAGARAVPVKQGATTPEINLSLAAGCTVSGMVVNRSDGAGLRNVYVSVFDHNWEFVAGDEVDLNGAFWVGKIPEGSYFVQATNSEGLGEAYYPDARSPDAAAPVKVAAGQDPPLIRILLGPAPEVE